MKRTIVLAVAALVVAGIAAAWYLEVGVNPHVKRDRFLGSGRAAMARGKLGEAVLAYGNALKADPNSAEAHNEMGLLLLKSGDPRAAFREFAQALTLRPNMIRPRFEMGLLHVMTRKLSYAEAQLEKIREIDEKAIEARLLAAEIALADKSPDKAVEEIKKAIIEHPEKPSLYVNLGGIYLVKRDFKAAENAYRKALELDSKTHLARVGLANIYLALSNQEKAEQELIRATEADPENEALLHVLGNFYTSTRKLDEFEKVYRNLLKKKPDSIVARKKLIELMILKGDIKQAKIYTDEILKSEPTDADGHYFKGRLHLAENDYEKASNEFAIVNSKSSRFAPAY